MSVYVTSNDLGQYLRWNTTVQTFAQANFRSFFVSLLGDVCKLVYEMIALDTCMWTTQLKTLWTDLVNSDILDAENNVADRVPANQNTTEVEW